ncbi:hypothetical protein IWQ61_010406 [Dispira simplex]|nr:hypothetical protein IWQ61_010406 [Dispira simplex]
MTADEEINALQEEVLMKIADLRLKLQGWDQLQQLPGPYQKKPSRMVEHTQEDPQEVHYNQCAPLVAVPKLANNKVHVIHDWLDQLEYVGSTNGWSSKELYQHAIIATML